MKIRQKSRPDGVLNTKLGVWILLSRIDRAEKKTINFSENQ